MRTTRRITSSLAAPALPATLHRHAQGTAFTFTRAAISTSGGAKSDFLSVNLPSLRLLPDLPRAGTDAPRRGDERDALVRARHWPWSGWAALSLLLLASLPAAANTVFTLGATNIVEGPAACTDAVVLGVAPASASWTAQANADWLHALTSAGQASTNLCFRCDANSGGTRTGTLTVGDQTVTITQAGASYQAAGATALAWTNQFVQPQGVAVDATGNVYFADAYDNAIRKWDAATRALSTVVEAGWGAPCSLALDSSHNVYFTGFGGGPLWRCESGATSPSQWDTSLTWPYGVAVDRADNVYVTDTDADAIKKRTPGASGMGTLVSGLGFPAYLPADLAVDAAGNLFFTVGATVTKWDSATHTVSTLYDNSTPPWGGVAVDGTGNIYFGDNGALVVRKWDAVTRTVGVLALSNLQGPSGVAVDGAGTVYVTDWDYDVDHAGQIAVLPRAFVDASGKVVDGDAGSDALPPVVSTAADPLGSLPPSSDQPWLRITGFTNGVVRFSFDAAPVSRTGHIALLGLSIPITQTVRFTFDSMSLVEGPQAGGDSVGLTAVVSKDDAWTATTSTSWLHISPGSESGQGTAAIGFSYDANPGPTRTGTLVIADRAVTVTQAGSTYQAVPGLSHVFADTNGLVLGGGGGRALAPVLAPAAVDLRAASSDASWLTIQSTTNGVLSFCVTDADTNRTAHISLLGISIQITQEIHWWLGVTNLVEGPGSGVDSVLLWGDSTNSPWTATNDVSWLHVTAVSQTGAASARTIFSFDANPGGTRTGSLTIASQTLTVTQAGAACVPARLVTLVATNLNKPEGVAADGAGNVYIIDTYNNALKEWVAAGNTVITLLSYELSLPFGVAVDGAGNVYIADTSHGAVKEWVAASNTLVRVSSGVTGAAAVAVDGGGNVYGADPSFNVITKWTGGVASNLVSSGLAAPFGVAVDVAGNVYIADSGHNAIKEWVAVSNAVNTLISGGLSQPRGVAVDGGGNVYLPDLNGNAVKKWAVASGALSTLIGAGLNGPRGVAVDAAGNVYVADTFHNAVKELPRAWVDAAGKTLAGAAGSDVLPSVVPAAALLTGPLAPASDQSWLTLTGVTNGLISFDFTATPTNRTANIMVLGVSVPITQRVNFALGVANLAAGPGAGGASVALSVDSPVGIWTATNNVSWLHISPGSLSGAGPAGILFSYDANPGEMRVGTLTIAGQTLTVTQAGSGWTAAPGLTNVFVDARGKVEGGVAGGDALPPVVPATVDLTGSAAPISDQPWLMVTGVTNGVVSFRFTQADATRTAHITLLGLSIPIIQEVRWGLGATNLVEGPGAGSDSVILLVDSPSRAWTATNSVAWLRIASTSQAGAGGARVFFSLDANPGGVRVGSLTIAGQTVTVTQAGAACAPARPVTLVATDLNQPYGVAVDRTGNVYIADTYNNAVKKWVSAGNTVSTLVADGLARPCGVAVDGAGNVYIADTDNSAVKEWVAASSTVIALKPLFGASGAVAVDESGNVYATDVNNNVVNRWAGGVATNLVSSGLAAPYGVAVDVAGNVYIADSSHEMIKEWVASSNAVSTLVTNGLNWPFGVAVDGGGNLYIADNSGNVIQKWTAPSGPLSTLIGAGLNGPRGVAVDAAGNLYVADSRNNAVKELPRAWVDAAGKTLAGAAGSDVLPSVVPAAALLTGPLAPASDQSWLTLTGVTNGLISFNFTATPTNRTANIMVLGVSVPITQRVNFALGIASLMEGPAGGGARVALSVDSPVGIWTATNNAPWLHISSGSLSGAGPADILFTYDANPGEMRVGTLTIAGQTLTVTQAGSGWTAVPGLTNVFVDARGKVEGGVAGGDALPPIVPATVDLTGSAAPTSDQPWLMVTGVTNGVVSFRFTQADAMRTAHITLLGLSIPIIQEVHWGLGATNLVEGPGAGGDSVILLVDSPSGAWTATADASWLHLSEGDQSGLGPANLVFTCDENSGANRSGTLTIAGQTVTVTQAGASWQPAQGWGLVVTNLYEPCAVALDRLGNVYVADVGNQAIRKWDAAGQTLVTLVTNLNQPLGVAVDGAGGVYIADTINSVVKKWAAAGNSVSTLVSGLYIPWGVAVDGAGNVYVADTGHNAIKKWEAATGTVIPLVSTGLSAPRAVAVDGAGNVYISDSDNNVVKEWIATSGTVITLVSNGLSAPRGLAVDGGGNVYIADTGHNAVKKWVAASNTVCTLSGPEPLSPGGVAVDAAGNVYVADTYNNRIVELPRAYVGPAAVVEDMAEGSDSWPAMISAGNGLAGFLAPTSNEPWLTVTGVTNGTVSLSFTRADAPRAGRINLLGVSILVTQQPRFRLGATNLVEGPDEDADSLVLAASSPSLPWTVVANDPWLYVAPDSRSGTGNATVMFALDINPGPTRVGSLTVAGQTVTITQAGSSCVPAQAVPLISNGLNHPYGVAVDASGNVYIADTYNNAVEKWMPSTGSLDTVVSNLGLIWGVAVDGAGNLYLANASHNAVEKWVAASNSISTLVSGLGLPWSVAVDPLNSVYVADSGGDTIGKWTSGLTNCLVGSELQTPRGVAVDAAGNVYIADTGNNMVKEWVAASNTVITLISDGLSFPYSAGVDGRGNVYIADECHGAIKKWVAANGTVVTLVSSGLIAPVSLAVDAVGNVYVADLDQSLILELPRVFIDPAGKTVGSKAGDDVLPAMVPATAKLTGPLAPSSDAPWLTITGVTNGAVCFHFTVADHTRTAHINLLGVSIPITQTGSPAAPPDLLAPSVSDGLFQFRISNSVPGATFALLSATNVGLPMAKWDLVSLASNQPAGFILFTNLLNPSEPQRFYRLQAQ